MEEIVTGAILKLEHVGLVCKIHEQLGYSKKYIATGMLGILLFFCVTSQGAQLCAFAAGSVYPIYVSYKTIQSQSALEQQKMHKYWVVWIVSTRCELALSTLLAFVPLFAQLKMIGYIANIYSAFNVSTHLYDQGIVPIFSSIENQLQSQYSEKPHTS